MRFNLPTVALITTACVPRAVQANFDTHHVEWIWINRPAILWQVFEAEAGCDDAIHSPIWEDHSDVSGSKMGVRCKGSGCAPQTPANNIDELEMHFSNSPLYHWTIYKNRGRSMMGLDGNAYGNCIVFPNGDYNCPLAGLKVEGRRKFRCLTKYTANDLRANARLAGGPPTLKEFVEASVKRDLTAVPFTG
ncbi:hypothetical protein LZ30DRAFT_777005 [Colletotrichum cereale]|nr:hypothetical protein LZ30DRAFT_777005 [Colletotrichum cereale]